LVPEGIQAKSSAPVEPTSIGAMTLVENDSWSLTASRQVECDQLNTTVATDLTDALYFLRKKHVTVRRLLEFVRNY
jgi:hypothetical protein